MTISKKNPPAANIDTSKERVSLVLLVRPTSENLQDGLCYGVHDPPGEAFRQGVGMREGHARDFGSCVQRRRLEMQNQRFCGNLHDGVENREEFF